MDDPAQPLRDYHDLTRKELIARLRHVKVLYTQVSFTHENASPRVIQAFGLAALMLIVMLSLTDSILIAGLAWPGLSGNASGCITLLLTAYGLEFTTQHRYYPNGIVA
uniref:Uncharacterized protein n=1 Tax=Pectobacterium carotovorum TaxID=554 RepID=A0A0N9NRZ3_PECCA|nr:hypothetical protein [Pectobacterium carotovorum]ALG88582.1 Hypothetical protein [Pectobacterium carotovorum]